MENGHQDIYGAIETNYNANVLSHREMNARVAELVTRMGALDGAIEHLAAVVARQYVRIAALEALVGASPHEEALTPIHLPFSAAIVIPKPVSRTDGH